MIKSLRWRLQLWYALIVGAVILIFSALVYGHAHHEMQRRVEEQLNGAVNYFDAVLRTFPRSLLTNEAAVDESKASLASDHLLHGLEFRGSLSRELELHHRDRPFFVVWRADQSVLVASDEETAERFADYRPPHLHEHVEFEHHRGKAFAFLRGPLETVIMVGKPVNHEFSRLHVFASHILLTGSGVMVLALAGGWFLSAQLVRPIKSISTTAAKLSATNLSERIDAPKLETELQPLALILNDALDRLQIAFAQLTQFTADASHELRTPLAVLQSQLELAAMRPRTVEEYQATLATCLKATERMRSLVDGLLMLARADAGRLELATKPLNLCALAEEAAEQIQPQAESAGVAIVCDLPRDLILVSGDASLLTRVIANLIANAVQHSLRGAAVNVSVRQSNAGEDTGGQAADDTPLGRATAVLTVADHGSGIPLEKQPQVFERFFRADPSRNRQSGGNGLGLSICRSLVTAHGGTIDFQSSPGVHTEFKVRLPLLQTSSVA